VLRFSKISKSYGRKQVLHNVSHCFGNGAFALRGQNGIGKSTLLKILAGAVQADTGTVWINQYPLQDTPLLAKARLSYIPDECPVYPFLTGLEFMRFVAYAKQFDITPEVQEIAMMFGLSDHLGTKFSDMSLGTQKKTMLTAAWIGDPSVLLFDEPSNGLDLQARDLLIEMLKNARKNRTILISTHDMDFVKSIEASVIPFDELSYDCRIQTCSEGCVSN
jgi:ABC-type multidrug transport system ATPase subunit